MELLVIDEADLIFSFGFEADLRFILTKLPTIFQVSGSQAMFHIRIRTGIVSFPS